MSDAAPAPYDADDFPDTTNLPSASVDVPALAIWRTIAPFSASPAIAERLAVAVLARLRNLPNGLGAADCAAIARADGGDGRAWAILADRIGWLLDDRAADEADLAGSCLWLAARHGSLWSYLVLCHRLAKTAAPDEMDDIARRARLMLLADVAGAIDVPGTPLTAIRSLGVDEEISQEIVDRQSRSARASPAVAVGYDTQDVEDAAAPGPTMPVLSTVPPPPASRDDKALVERYAALAKPTRLVPLPDADAVAAVLTAEFPWMADIIDTIHADIALAARCGARHVRLPPMLLVGPSGVGKSRFAHRLGGALGLPAGWVNAGGSSDNRALAGTARGWSTTSPCLPLAVMLQHKIANPLVVIDEIDKTATSSHNGCIADTLLTMTEPGTARAWPDECLQTTADLSKVTWVLLANRIDLVHPLLRSRCRVIAVSAPRPQDFAVLLAGALADIADEFGVPVEALPPLEPKTVDAMQRGLVRGGLQARQLVALVRRALAVTAQADCRQIRH